MKRLLFASVAFFALSVPAAYAQGTPTAKITADNNDDVNRRLDTQKTGGTGLNKLLDKAGQPGSGNGKQETAAGVPKITDDNNDDESQLVPAN